MKKTQRIELFKNIKGTAIQFVSITMFIALAIAVFTGIRLSSDSLKSNINEFSQSGNLHDVEIGPFALGEELIDELKSVDGVDEVEGSYTTYANLTLGSTKNKVKIISLTERIDKPVSVEGTLPAKMDEIAVEGKWAKEHDIKPGDTITFESNESAVHRQLTAAYRDTAEGITPDAYRLNDIGEGENHQNLKTNSFKVTALIELPEYVNVDANNMGASYEDGISLDCVMAAPVDAFDLDSYIGYSSLLVRSDSLRGMSIFSDEYKAQSEDLKDRIEPVVSSYIDKTNVNLADCKSEVLKSVDGALNDSRIKLENADREYNSKINELNAKKKEFDEAPAKLKEAEKQIKEKEQEYNEFKASDYYQLLKLANKLVPIVRKAIDQYAADVEQLKAALEPCIPIIEQMKGLQSLSPEFKAAISQLEDFIRSPDSKSAGVAKSILGRIEKELNKLNATIAKAESELARAKAELERAKQLVKDARVMLPKVEQQLKEAKAKLDEAWRVYRSKEAEVNRYRDTKAEIPFYINTGATSVGVYMGDQMAEVFNRICYSMALLFVMVGLFICYSSLSRLINEQVKMIGTKKALGVLQKEITAFYMSYAGIALAIGCTLGLIIGIFPVQKILLSALSNIYTIDGLKIFVKAGPPIGICLIEIVLILLITYMACGKILRQSAVSLLAGPVPPEAKQRFFEKSKTWEKMSLINKTIVNNLFNDKSRVIGTIIGVAGCTALIVTSMTMSERLGYTFNLQFDKLYDYEVIVQYDSEIDGAQDRIQKVLDDNNAASASIIRERQALVFPDGIIAPTQTIVPIDEAAYAKLAKMTVPGKPDNQVTKDGSIPKGIWVCGAFSKYYSVAPGDEIEIVKSNGSRIKCKMNGSYGFYNPNEEMTIDKETYAEEFGEAKANAFAVDITGVDFEKLQSELSEVDGYIATTNIYENSQRNVKIFVTISTMLNLIYIALAIVMAAFVLLNTLIMFVAEKKRELIILMINGYSVKYARRYIYSDTILLTIIGIILGMVVGSIMGNLSVSSFESSVIYVIYGISLKACLVGAVLSGLFAFVACMIAMKKIGGFKLSDINRI